MMWDEEYEQTQEEENLNYLEQNPHIEYGMWSEWVVVVCGWEKIDRPNNTEWEYLRYKWYSGVAPVESVDQLKRLRDSLI